MKNPIGVLLVNLGTPDAPTEEAVRKYLDVFLSDPYVITLPKILRDFLVQKVILRKRPKLSAHAYQKVWTPNGSPLLVNSVALQDAVAKNLGSDYVVALGMRYENPSMASAIEFLKNKNCEKIVVLPLFPQFSSATTQSALDNIDLVFNDKNHFPELKIVRDFHNQEFYTHSFADIIQTAFNKNNSEFVLMSYHGLPSRYPGAHHYRQQCYVSSELIAKKAGLNQNQFQVSFQSRLGFTKWISPYTDHVIKALRKRNIKRLAVVCPSFVADCIETLEEIDIRLRAQWLMLGGESFELIPCLNADEVWVKALSDMIIAETRPAGCV
ncbi:MAG: ferrochelatase [Gammaproteobacteria bacterium]|nr:ferrochelatase [Gammaproteobacteria bacterium]